MFRELTDSELSQVCGGGTRIRNRQRIDGSTGDNKFKLIAPHADEVNVNNFQNTGNVNLQQASIHFET